MSPAEEKALLQQGIAAARAGDKPAARARFRELTGKNFDNELAWLWLASVADTPAHAMACLRRVLQINESNDKARAALFRLLMEKGIEAARANDKSSAYALFQEASNLDPASELVWTWLASTAPAPPLALAALRRVLQLNPGHEQAARAFKKLIVQQSVELAQAGDPAARDLLTEATSVDPENETLWLWLARSVPSAEAAPLYERVLQINPANDAARAALRLLRPEPEPAHAADPMLDEPTAPDLESELEADFDAVLEPADLDEDLASADAASSPEAGSNGHGYGHSHGHGHAQPHEHGPANGAVNGSENGYANGHVNGHTNGHANGLAGGDGHGASNGQGQTIGRTNGHAAGQEVHSTRVRAYAVSESGEYILSDSHDIDGGDADGRALSHRTGLGQKSSHAIDLSQLNLEDDPAPEASITVAAHPAPVQYETNADYSGARYTSSSTAHAYTTDETSFMTSSDYPLADGGTTGTSYTGAPAGLVETNAHHADVDSYLAASEQTYADSASHAYTLAGSASASSLLDTQESTQDFEVTRNDDYGDYAASSGTASAYAISTDPIPGLVLNADAATPQSAAYVEARLDASAASAVMENTAARSEAGGQDALDSGALDSGALDGGALANDAVVGASVEIDAVESAAIESDAFESDAVEQSDAAVVVSAPAVAARTESLALAEPEPAAGSAAVTPGASASASASAVAVGSILGVSQIVPAPAPVPSGGRSAWDCPICLSGAPEGAVRCPNCGCVVTLDDPDLLMQTDDVDRRHVLQVVARLKNRAAGSDQFDHQFTLGLAYVNANRLTEGLGHLRMASQLRPRDQKLKAQIDALERRAAQGVRRAKSGAPVVTPPPVSASAPTSFKSAPSAPAAPAEVTAPAVPAVESLAADHLSADTFGESSTSGVAAAPAGSTDGRRLILVVDDSPTIQKVVSVTLEAHGHEVVTASDGMEALAKLRTMKPDLVLLDITMPHMDGYQLCRILRSNDLTRQVPIVMLSGKDGLFDKMRGRMAGAATYITKPFAPSALPPLVEKYCKR